MKYSGLIAAALLLGACGGEAGTEAAPDTEIAAETAGAEEAGPAVGTLAWAAAGAWRTDEEKARDAWRHPVETLEFLGVRGDDTVVEIWPGGGWYTQILAPYLKEGGGTLVAVGADANRSEGAARSVTRFAEAYVEKPDTYGDIVVTALSADTGEIAADGSADVVLTFRNVHNWMNGGYEATVFEKAYAALRPGGMLGVVEHRLPSAAVQDPTGSTGYVHEDYVKALAEAAGFELVASSEINANPADTADHPFGVWTLPPNSSTEDREGNTPDEFSPEVYKAIGESDRMTLKFVKPS